MHVEQPQNPIDGECQVVWVEVLSSDVEQRVVIIRDDAWRVLVNAEGEILNAYKGADA
jgi:hypothetical protein